MPDKRDEVIWIPQPTPNWWERVGKARWEEISGPISANAASVDRDAVKLLREQPPDETVGGVMDRQDEMDPLDEDYRAGILWWYVDQGELGRQDSVGHAVERLNEIRLARWRAHRARQAEGH